MKKIIILLFMFSLLYSPIIVKANVAFNGNPTMECSVSSVLSDDKIINIIVNDDETFSQNGKWFHAIMYDSDKQLYEDIELDNQVDTLFHSMSEIWIYHIDILPTEDGGFMMCIPFNEGYYLDLYDYNYKHIDSKTIVGGNTFLEGDTINSDIHHTIKYGLGRTLICIKKDMRYGYNGDTCYRVRFGNVIDILKVEVPEDIVFGSYIPMPDDSVLALEWDGDRIYRSYANGFCEKKELPLGVYDILKMGRNSLPSQWTFHKDDMAQIITLDYSTMKLVEIIIDTEFRIIDYKLLASNINDDWDCSELIVRDFQKTDDNYFVTCWCGKHEVNYGATWEYTVERVLDSNGCTTGLYKYINNYYGVNYHENICRVKDNQYVMVNRDNFQLIEPEIVHEWDEGQLIKTEVDGIEVCYLLYTCYICGDERKVYLDACGLMYNDMEYVKDMEYCRMILDNDSYRYTGYKIIPKEIVYYKDKKLENGKDYVVSCSRNIDAGEAMITVIGINNYCGMKTMEYTIVKADKPEIIPEDYYEVNYSSDKVDNSILPDNWKFENSSLMLEVGLNSNIKVLYNGIDKENFSNTVMYINIFRNNCIHEWDEGIVAKEATTTETGLRIYRCKICQITKSESIDILQETEYGSQSGSESDKEEETIRPEGDNTEETTRPESDKSEETTRSDGEKTEEAISPKGNKEKEITGFERDKADERTNLEEEKLKEISENNSQTINNKDSKAVLKIEEKDNAYIIYKKNKYVINGMHTVSFLKPLNRNIKKITIPNIIKYKNIKYEVNAVSDYACKGLKRLNTVSMGDNVKRIGRQAFSECRVLKQISFGSGVKKLDSKVLYDDISLRKIIFKSKKITTFGKKTFYKVPKKVDIIIPRKKMKKYVKLIKKSK